jgi:gentisate 1,2-dioxygenase
MSALSTGETPHPSLTDVSALGTVNGEASDLNLTPSWVPRTKPISWLQPRSEFVPAHWSYDDARAILDASGPLIDLSLAERRALGLRNPAPGINFETARTLGGAYQMILPRETAPSHRHSSHAVRVIIDGKGSYAGIGGWPARGPVPPDRLALCRLWRVRRFRWKPAMLC